MHGGGMGAPVPGRIPWACIDRWALRHGIEGTDFDLLLRLMGEMDAIFLDHIRSKAPRP
jgi:hypothetical protein